MNDSSGDALSHHFILNLWTITRLLAYTSHLRQWLLNYKLDRWKLCTSSSGFDGMSLCVRYIWWFGALHTSWNWNITTFNNLAPGFGYSVQQYQKLSEKWVWLCSKKWHPCLMYHIKTGSQVTGSTGQQMLTYWIIRENNTVWYVQTLFNDCKTEGKEMYVNLKDFFFNTKVQIYKLIFQIFSYFFICRFPAESASSLK